MVQLLPEFSNCVNNFGSNKNYDDCMYSELYELMLQNVGCTVPWLLNRSNICIENTKRNLSFTLYQQNRRNQENICPNRE